MDEDRIQQRLEAWLFNCQIRDVVQERTNSSCFSSDNRLNIVNLSARSIYACLAAIELAQQYDAGTPVQIRRISERHDIPSRFLVQILLQLKSAGLVSSTRGAAGGYQLAQAPSAINVWEILEAVENSSETSDADAKQSPERKVLSQLWNQAFSAYQHSLKEMTLEGIMEQLGADGDPMYFI